MKLAIAVAVVILMFAGAVAGSYALSVSAIDHSNRQWCATLTLLTSNAHPATPNSRVFYAKLHDLENRFGC